MVQIEMGQQVTGGLRMVGDLWDAQFGIGQDQLVQAFRCVRECVLRPARPRAVERARPSAPRSGADGPCCCPTDRCVAAGDPCCAFLRRAACGSMALPSRSLYHLACELAMAFLRGIGLGWPSIWRLPGGHAFASLLDSGYNEFYLACPREGLEECIYACIASQHLIVCALGCLLLVSVPAAQRLLRRHRAPIFWSTPVLRVAFARPASLLTVSDGWNPFYKHDGSGSKYFEPEWKVIQRPEDDGSADIRSRLHARRPFSDVVQHLCPAPGRHLAAGQGAAQFAR